MGRTLIVANLPGGSLALPLANWVMSDSLLDLSGPQRSLLHKKILQKATLRVTGENTANVLTLAVPGRNLY
jgi:hypothetical protein